MREDLRDPRTRFAILREFVRGPHDRPDGTVEEPGILVETGEFLAVALFEFGLIVPGIDLAWAAVREDPDDRIGPAGKVPPMCSERVDGGGCAALLCEQSGERHGPEPRSRARQELAAGSICRDWWYED